MAGSPPIFEFEDDSQFRWVSSAPGPGAERLAAARSHVSPTEPASSLASKSKQPAAMTLAEFVELKFLPDHIVLKRGPGQRHYQAILKHVLPPEVVDRIFGISFAGPQARLKTIAGWPYLHNMLIEDVQPQDVQKLIMSALSHGYSTQMAKHIRNVVSAIFAHALRGGYVTSGNPAAHVRLPGMQRKTPHVLTLEQTSRVLELMRYPEWEITVILLMTGMYMAEICGLQWESVNLTDRAVERHGDLIPARSISVRQQWARGELSEVPESRRRNIPISAELRSMLANLSDFRSPKGIDFVLTSRTGKPVNQINIAARRLKLIGVQLDIPWLSWQVFRRTRSQLIVELGAKYHTQIARAIGVTARYQPRSGKWKPLR